MAEPGGDGPRVRVVSGGQSGVDRAALEVARELGLPLGGWCPADGWAEDLPDPPGLLGTYPELTPTPARDPVQRTLWNVRDSDATVVLVPDGGWLSPGTRLTVEAAAAAGRLCLVHRVTGGPAEVTAWLAVLAGPSGWAGHPTPAPLVLNVAGPRESEAPGIGAAAAELLRATFVTLR